uniref:Putative small nuclear ribonucleoprotein n=1 Tax=Trypanosoma congolense (strain IL3000) TaxID=1068625 RepID=G0UW85_TRYCI|nr:putative small nuclear ribonucleoprotein [Trypanosoma congolense IL3000]
MNSGCDIPCHAVRESTNLVVKVETTDDCTYVGRLTKMDCTHGDMELVDVRCQHRDSSLSVEGRVLLKGSSVRIVHLPSDLKRAPFLDWRNLDVQKHLKINMKISRNKVGVGAKKTSIKTRKVAHQKKKKLL